MNGGEVKINSKRGGEERREEKIGSNLNISFGKKSLRFHNYKFNFAR